MAEPPTPTPRQLALFYAMAALFLGSIVVGGLHLGGVLPRWPGLVLVGIMLGVNGWLLVRAARARRREAAAAREDAASR